MDIPNNIENESKLDIFTKEELENAYSVNSEDNKKKDFNEFYNEKIEDIVDDSYIYEEDKVNLLKVCKDIVDKNYHQYPYPMDGILTKNLYYDCIKRMDKQEYINEKLNLEKLNPVEKELLQIKNSNNYFNKKKPENEIMDLNEFLED
jgi:hypothetical protein